MTDPLVETARKIRESMLEQGYGLPPGTLGVLRDPSDVPCLFDAFEATQGSPRREMPLGLVCPCPKCSYRCG